MREDPQKCKKGRQADFSLDQAQMIAVKNQTAATDTCICSGNLSGYADGEYELTQEEKHHLEVCPSCKKLLADFRKLSQCLHDDLQIDCPEELVNIMSERVQFLIKEECKAQGKKKKLLFSRGRFIFHAAASIMLFSFILFLLTDSESEADANIPAPSAGKIQSVTMENTTEKTLPEITGSVDIRNLVHVSTSADVVHFLASAKENKRGNPVKIDPEVAQLWTYAPGKNVFSSIKKLLIASAGKKAVESSKTNAAEKKLSFTVTTSRKQAVHLVRNLAAAGFQLLSPVQPQPEQKLFYGTGKEKTILKLDFLPAK